MYLNGSPPKTKNLGGSLTSKASTKALHLFTGGSVAATTCSPSTASLYSMSTSTVSSSSSSLPSTASLLQNSSSGSGSGLGIGSSAHIHHSSSSSSRHHHHKRSKRVGPWGARERAGMSFLIVVAFFAVFGLIILTEVRIFCVCFG